MSTEKHVKNAQPAGLLGLGSLLHDVSREADLLAEQCAVLQQSLSAILDVAHHPDIKTEIHMLQDIDRVQQTLSDLARILRLAEPHADAVTVERREMAAAIRLESLRNRLGLSPCASGETAQATGRDASDITWL